MKHTPGPWLLNRNNYPACYIESKDGQIIASVPKQEIANACLIAAAPELLSIIKALAEQGEWYSSAVEFKNCNGLELLERMLAAVESVEGRKGE